MAKKKPLTFPTLKSLNYVEKLISDSGKAIGDKSRALANTEVPEILGVVGLRA